MRACDSILSTGLADSYYLQVLDLQKDAPVYHFNYTYNIRQDNFNGRTIQKFSALAKQEMWDCDSCPYPDYAKFVNYYDAYEYGDQWIEAAINGKATSFTNGNLDFTDRGRPSRAGE